MLGSLKIFKKIIKVTVRQADVGAKILTIEANKHAGAGCHVKYIDGLYSLYNNRNITLSVVL